MTYEDNGTKPEEEDLVAQEAIRARVAALTREKEALEKQLEKILPRLRRYERALTMLMAPEEPPKRGRPKGREEGAPVRATPSRIGPEKLEAIKNAVLRFAAEHDEFRQVDIRTMPDTPTDKSSYMALAFERLRQEGVIRVARQEGNNKYYRLTREALQAGLSNEQR